LNQTTIIDYFSSDRLYPNQQGNFWFKFNKFAHFDKISIDYDDKYDGLTEIISKNRLTPVMQSEQKDNRGFHHLLFTRKSLIMDGYFGFDFVYTKIPKEETKITFVVNLLDGNYTIARQYLEISIIRPILISEQNILDINDYDYREKLFRINIINTGSATARNLELVPYSSNRNIRIKLRNEKIEKIEYDFIEKIIIINNMKIEIFGKGYAVITLVIKYYDAFENAYSSILSEILVSHNRNSQAQLSIPLSDLKQIVVPQITLNSE
jgi:hypothetical protein